jgi:hypothetical protein
METFQDALTEYKNCPGYDGLAPTQWAFGRLQRTSIPCPSKAYDRVTDDQLKEHLGRRGRIQDQDKGPRSSPKELSPGESVRIQDHRTKHWSKRAKVIKKRNPRSYLLKSGGKTFIRNIRFIKPDPGTEDTEHAGIAQEVRGSNPADRKAEDTKHTGIAQERHPEVHGSNPTDGPMTRSRSFRDHCQ